MCSKILIDYGGIDWGIKNAFKEIKLLLLSLSGSVSLLAQKCVYCILWAGILFELFRCLQFSLLQIEIATFMNV